MNNTRTGVRDLTIAGLCLAAALVLPFFTGQIPQIGSMLCPMHIPVLLCAFLCRVPWAAIVGFAAPLLRFALFSMPQMPFAMAMAFEMAVYGLAAAAIYKALPNKKISIYISLIAAMILGRIVWGAVSLAIAGLNGNSFTWGMFIGGAVIESLPGIVIQLVLIPVIVMAIKKERV